MLALSFAEHIQLTEDYYAPGSLGNFNLQVTLQVENQLPYDVTPEILLVTMNSGLWVNERGTSAQYTGVLTKSDVLECSAQEPVFKSSVKRMIGGGWLDSLKSIAGKLLPHLLKASKEELGKHSHPVAQMAHKALGFAGYGASGGGASGGGASAGQRMKLADRLAN
jgi:hypothetical protein